MCRRIRIDKIVLFCYKLSLCSIVKPHIQIYYRCELSQRLLPTFEKLADSFNDGDKLKLAKVNCDDNEEFCKEKQAKGKNFMHDMHFRNA